MASSVGIDNLPPHLLHRIFEYLHGHELGKVTGGNLNNSLLVCRKWQTQARLVLYGNVDLDLDKFGRFLDAFDPDAVSRITHRLTVRLLSREESPDMVRTQSIEGRIDDWLRRLAQDVLPRMRQLHRFFATKAEKFPPFRVQKRTMTAVLMALPVSCVSLALKVDVVGEGHLCETIRDLLPRMNRVVLGVSPVCYSMLGAYAGQEFHLSSLPKSLFLIVQCKVHGSQVQACPEPHWQWSISVKESITTAVKRAVEDTMEAVVVLIPGGGRMKNYVGMDLRRA